MHKQDIQQLRLLPIESVATRLGLTVKNHKSLCPFHDDKHPSLTFSVSRNSYKCYACGAHGGVIDLAMHLLGRIGSDSFITTCQWLASEYNVILTTPPTPKPTPKPKPTPTPKPKPTPKPFNAGKYLRYFENPYLNPQAVRFLYHERHLDPRVIRWCRLTSWMEWLQIPYLSLDGHITGIQWRYLGTDKNHPRFRFPAGSQCHVYNLPILNRLQAGEALYITEGCSDCWAMLSSGHKAIAIPSATLLKADDLTILASIGQKLGSSIPLHIYPDADEPGDKLYRQLLTVCTQIGSCLIKHTLPPGCKDYSDYYLASRREE